MRKHTTLPRVRVDTMDSELQCFLLGAGAVGGPLVAVVRTLWLRARAAEDATIHALDDALEYERGRRDALEARLNDRKPTPGD